MKDFYRKISDYIKYIAIIAIPGALTVYIGSRLFKKVFSFPSEDNRIQDAGKLEEKINNNI